MKKLIFITFIFFKTLATNKVDFILYSYDRPMQLYALLESMEKYITDGKGEVSIIYRVSNHRYNQAYEIVKSNFPLAHFYKQGKKPQADFKPLVMKCAFETPNKYMSTAVDDILVKDYVSLTKCIHYMEKTNAYNFLLRLGKNTQKCYTMKINTPIPSSFKQVDPSEPIYTWTFENGLGDWNFPSNNDMTIFRKSDVKPCFEKILPINFTNTFYEPYWCSMTSRKQQGLCFEYSKIVNLCINIVMLEQPSHAQFSKEWVQNKMHLFSPESLLNKFEEGYKIDISQLYKINNISAHIEFEPMFIKR